MPNAARMPTTKAVSVEITMPQAPAWGPPALMAPNTRAGTTRPQAAASTGTQARRHSRSPPITKSCLTCRLTSRKNIIIRPSLIQCRNGMSMPQGPKWTDRRAFQNAS